MSEKHLTTRDFNIWQMISNKPIAEVFQESRLFGVATVEQAAAIMLKGYELGLGLSASFEFIHVIDGKPSISPKGMLALIHKSGLLAEMKISDESDACTVTMRRTNGFEYTTRYTMDDAKAAGIVRSGGAWEKYRANMLRWRAIGYCADIVFPDLGGGMYRPEELGADVGPDGEPIEAEYVTVSQAPSPPEPAPTSPAQPPPPETLTLNELVQEWGAPRIVQAFGGIPATVEQMEDVQGRLEVWEANKDAVEAAGLQNILDNGFGKFPGSSEELAKVLEALGETDGN